ncbi:MAG: FGGY family carbohydrate kinase [Pseudomonadota bacterium]
MTILAIDQGTTSTRAVSVSPEGQTTIRCVVEHRQIYPRPGWVEHDPEELTANLETCLEAGSGARAVGLDNQGESCLAWDAATGKPLSPVIVWQDERTLAETERLRSDGAEALTLARAGLPLDPYFSASKLAWLFRNVPDAPSLARAGRLRLGTTDAFFRQRLTGHCATDPTTASRTALMDLASCQWDAELCALFGVPLDCLPEIAPTTGRLGEIGGMPLTASVVDQQAALRGHGCTEAGAAKFTFGTGAFALAVCGESLPQAGSGPLPTVAWAQAGTRPTYALDGGVYAAAAAVNWARALGLFSDFDAISQFDSAPAVSRGLVFVPALAGLACPHWDRRAKGAWLGMALDTGKRDLVQAVLEGVAFRAAEVIDAFAALHPLDGPLSIDGGMTRNPWFCQFLSDALGREVAVSDEPERTALGTAHLAAHGAGIAMALPRADKRITPRPMPDAWRARFAQARGMVQDFGAGSGA